MAEIGQGIGTGYPSALDTDNTIEVNSPNAGKTKARAEVVNDLAAAVIAIETELGTNPSGSVADVKTYLQVEHGVTGVHTDITADSVVIDDAIDIVDIRAYLPAGYVTDGSVDYSTEIQSAITAGSRIFVPKGTWLCQNLNVRGYRHLFGAGKGNTVLKIPAASTSWLINSTDGATGAWLPYTKISDLTIDGNSSTTALGGIYAEFVTQWVFENIEIYGFYNANAVGIKLDHTYQTAFRDCYIRMGSAGAGKKGTACFQIGASTADAIHTTHVTFDNCLAQYSGTGFFLSALGNSGDEFTIRQCAAGNHDYGIRVQDFYRSLRVENTLIENTSINGFRASTATAQNIKNVTIDSVRVYEGTIALYADSVDDLKVRHLQLSGDDAGGHTIFSIAATCRKLDVDEYIVEGTAYDTVVASSTMDPYVTNLNQNDNSPDVYLGCKRHTFITNNTNPTTISAFDNGFRGQEITVIFNDANTTIDFTSTTLKGNAGVDFTGAATDVMTCVYDGTNWYCQVHDNTP